MFMILKLPAMLRAAVSLFRAGDYLGTIKVVAEVLGLLGLADQAQKLLDAATGAAQENARAIAVAALGLIADVFTMVYGGEPITVQSVPVAGAIDGEAILGRLEFAAKAIEDGECEAIAMAQPSALDPAVVAVLIELGAQLLRRLFERRLGRQFGSAAIAAG